MSEALLVVIISGAFTLIVNTVGLWLNRRATFAKASADSAEAAESLSMTAKNLTETQSKEIIIPLRERIEEMRVQLSVMEEDRFQEREQFQKEIKALKEQDVKLNSQIEFMRGELRRSDNALEHLASVVKSAFPVAVDEAIKIRRGQL